MTNTQKTGLLGEILAARYLRDKAYTIAAANYKTKTGEIDIIANDNGTCVIVEVKSRTAGGMLAPAEAVDYAKEQRIKNTAAAYMSAKKLTAKPRFDIIEVIFDGENHTINHIQNAF